MLRRVPAASVSRTWSVWLSSLAASERRSSSSDLRARPSRARPRRRPAPSSASALARSSSCSGRPGAPPAPRRHSRLLGGRAPRCRSRAAPARSASVSSRRLGLRSACGPRARAAPRAERSPPATCASCTCQWTRCSRAASCSASSSASSARVAASSSSSRPRASSPWTSAASIFGQPLLGGGQPLGEPRELGLRVVPLAGQVGQPGGQRPRAWQTACRSASRARSEAAAASVEQRSPARPGAPTSPAARSRQRPRAAGRAPTSCTSSASSARRRSGPEGAPAPERKIAPLARRRTRPDRVENLGARERGAHPAGGWALRPQPVLRLRRRPP